MATRKKASSSGSGKAMVIVESPAKARTISKFLGSDYAIEASVGHIRDLPSSAAEIPASVKGQAWARLGIDVDNKFKPLYVVPKAKKDQIKKLKALLKDAEILYLATDEDREGESISWHLVQELKPQVEIKRLVFHEITKEAIQHALDNTRDLDEDLVEAQETRRVVDRLVGYSVSPLLWKKVRPKLSAGRVQSVAVRLIVEREQERIAFKPADYWSLEGHFTPEDGPVFTAGLHSVDGKRIALGKDFDPDTGALKADLTGSHLHLDGEAAGALAAALNGKLATVTDREQKPFRERPQPPFTTSTLQQEAGGRLRFAAQRTMRAAQRLYENGYITYMRTDSTTLSKEAVEAARTRAREDYGADHVPGAPRTYASKVKNAQEAHEAIRPAGSNFRRPGELGAEMGPDEQKLYELIYRRTVACQMEDLRGFRTTLGLAVDAADGRKARFQTSGRTIEFNGFRAAYAKASAEDGKGDKAEKVLPSLQEGDTATLTTAESEDHTTQPPARLTEATLVKELEARGIGRPSTYASIIETILAREYVFKKGNALVPTWTAFAVTRLLSNHLGSLVDYEFTAKMENDLDEISNGRMERLEYLQSFYHGNGNPGLVQRLQGLEEKIDPREVCSIHLGENDQSEKVTVRVGRYGPYLECGELRASVPDATPPDELTLTAAIELLAKGGDGPKQLGVDPETGREVFLKIGRFGPYFQLGDPEKLDGEKPKNASLLKGMDPETVTLDDALACLSLPRTVGVAKTPDTTDGPGTDEEILAADGRYGPYIRWGKETRSIPEDMSPLTITMEQAQHLLAQPKARGRSRSAPKILKELGKHPETEIEIRILDGRYGPYVSDGEIHASVPKGKQVDEVGLAEAVELLEARAAKKPRKKKARKKKAAKKKAKKKTTKKVSKKATSAKKVVKKASKKAGKKSG